MYYILSSQWKLGYKFNWKKNAKLLLGSQVKLFPCFLLGVIIARKNNVYKGFLSNIISYNNWEQIIKKKTIWSLKKHSSVLTHPLFYYSVQSAIFNGTIFNVLLFFQFHFLNDADSCLLPWEPLIYNVINTLMNSINKHSLKYKLR